MAKDDYDAAAKELGRIGEEMKRTTAEELTALGHFAVGLITTRTSAGIDASGRPFVPYTDEYADWKASKGRSRRPDLAFTGHMMQSLTPHVGDGEVTLRFQSANEARKAAAHNDGVRATVTVRGGKRAAHQRRMKLARREFMDIRLDREVEAMEKALGTKIAGRVERIVQR